MSRFINYRHELKKLSPGEAYKVGTSVEGKRAVATIDGKEKIGKVVYKRKAEYRKIFEHEGELFSK
ncbi:hypothetical protein [Metabacillus fastidiosus]|uniref:hypothetical protein n=1 Tax=Metabacillus fastidiosus TaxID=1458 RepID=UPI002DB91F9F|nr:hypothetical protein [Metabacillus fastidiosus]MEC2074501.1 hypothetical protein [Metabacillus fastidiosus]